jgi:ABC-2 type transport system permease protein
VVERFPAPRFFRGYLSLIIRSFIKTLAFRTEALLWLVLEMISLLLLLVVWKSIYQAGSSFGGYSLGQILTYYFLTNIVNGVTATHFEAWRVREIREGKIDYFLTKPLAFPLMIFLESIGDKLLYICLLLPLYFVLWLGLAAVLPIAPVVMSVQSIATFGLLMLFGFVVECLLGICIVMLGFWFEGSEGLEHFKWLFVTLFSGWLVPLTLMPGWLRAITAVLPFQYIYALPIGVLQGTASVHLKDVAAMLGTLLVLLLCVQFLWRRGIRQYASAGG